MPSKLVIIPTYNELENIQKIIAKVFSLEGDFHILVVDDGSPDGTADIVKSLQVKDQKGTLDKFFTYDCWGAIYSENDYTLPHTHGPALWSWVYYIEVPNNAPPLYFPQAKLRVHPRPDEIVIFPGHVIHEVPPAVGMSDERIVLAGNIYLDYRNT